LDADYWERPESKKHLIGRLICLNKDYPKIGQYENYRPIIVLSPIYKFLEGYLMKSLRHVAKHHISKDQYGFVPGISI
jgi:hypothetical protein